jgi:hypothetical protein
MAELRHYILTRFNTGLYGPNPKTRTLPEEWMDHRMRLFTTITLPSMAAQTCQDFTWLVLMDRQTPERYVRTLEREACRNMKITYLEPDQPRWLRDFAPGQYDLVTTRIDNDDAFHRDAVKAIQDVWRARHGQQAKPWLIVFPFGLILDLADRRMWVMEYWFNNCPTMVEDSHSPRTVYRWQHSEIPPEVPRHYAKDKPYWLQVIHSQNLLNAVRGNNPLRIVHEELPGRIEFLYQFGIDPACLPSS